MQIDVNNSKKCKFKKKTMKFSSQKRWNSSSLLGEYNMWRGIRRQKLKKLKVQWINN